jgi:hypothetical protein
LIGEETRTTHVNITWEPMLGLLFIASLIYLPRLNSTITYDEAYTLRHYSCSLPTALMAYTTPNNHFVNSFFVWLSTGLSGDSEFVIRLPAFFAGILSIALIYRLSRRMVDSQAGLAAAMVLMSMAGIVHYSTTARGYIFSVLFTLVLIGELLFRRRQRYGILASSFALMMTLPSMILLVGATLIWSWKNRKEIILPILVGALAGIAFYIPVGWQSYEELHRHGSKTISELFQSFWPNMFAHPLLAGAIVLLAVVGWFRLTPPPRPLILCCFATAILVIPVQFIATGTLFFGRNYIYLLPLLALLVGVIIAEVLRNYTLLAVGLASLVAVPLLWYRPQPTAVLLLLEQVEQHVTEDEAVVIGCCLDEPLLYYTREQPWIMDPSGKERIFFIESPPYLEIADFMMYTEDYLTCESDEDWGEFSVYLCLPREK